MSCIECVGGLEAHLAGGGSYAMPLEVNTTGTRRHDLENVQGLWSLQQDLDDMNGLRISGSMHQKTCLTGLRRKLFPGLIQLRMYALWSTTAP
jgi:hypothetical protein